MSLLNDELSQLLDTYLYYDTNRDTANTQLEDFPSSLTDFTDSQQSLSTINVNELKEDGHLLLEEDIKPNNAVMLEDFAGDLNFEIGFEPQKKVTKSVTWTYSESLSKLYADMGKPCPVLFRASAPGATLPSDTVIRCLPVYAGPTHCHNPVIRCPNHASVHESSSSSELGQVAPPSHFIRCDDRERCYVEDTETGQQSVTVPYRPREPLDWMPVIYRFMCFSSCVGNLARRQIQAIFTLESGVSVLGRRTIELRICACPGRDRRNDESLQRISKCTAAMTDGPVAPPIETSPSVSPVLPSVDRSPRTDDDTIYTIKVRGARNFALMSRINEALELSCLVTPQQLQLHQQQQQHQQQHSGTRPVDVSCNKTRRTPRKRLKTAPAAPSASAIRPASI